MRTRLLFASTLVALACGSTTYGGPQQPPGATSTASATTQGPPAETEPEDTGEDDASFFGFEDVAQDGEQCDPWLQNCAAGFKCMPWANDGGNGWNATRCTPLDPNPRRLYETCTVELSGVSGIDNCELGAMCWDVDPATKEGTCLGMCLGAERSPMCEDPDATCAIFGDGVRILCYPNCDPVQQDCLVGQGCYPVVDAFTCAPDASGADAGAAGDRCEFLNACDPGLICVAAATVAGCSGAQGCCSPACDLTDPTASAACPGAPAEYCKPWFEFGATPPGFGHVGVCALPR